MACAVACLAESRMATALRPYGRHPAANTRPAISAAASSCITGMACEEVPARARGRGVSEALGDGLAVNACLQRQGGVRVPQVIQLDLREQRLLHRLPPVAPERLGVESGPFSRVKSRTVLTQASSHGTATAAAADPYSAWMACELRAGGAFRSTSPVRANGSLSPALQHTAPGRRREDGSRVARDPAVLATHEAERVETLVRAS